ncbi:GcrA cell cycle regulator [uncultured Caudovirales phage]|uniref:GcrA cell cycle regulator n=1 Tax=uncultured Caudovirales phage TaxID=2100421 RepID=A0A6J5KKV9_9CAUD|nr:GcrA cell cycle regulator [uncultured Caudovirales phage]
MSNIPVAKNSFEQVMARAGRPVDKQKEDLSWGADEQAQLVSLVSVGLSGSQIAEILGRSRNSIVGRCYRCGLQLRGKSTGVVAYRVAPKKRESPGLARTKFQVKSGLKTTPPKPIVEARPVKVAKEIAPAFVPLRISLVDLSNSMCRFPVDGASCSTLFCGLPKAGASYCSHHHAIANIQTNRGAIK